MIVALYRVATFLFPPAFRIAYAACMTADFEDGWADVRRFGSRRRHAGWLACVVVDLLWTMGTQWLRTPVPWLTVSYSVAISAMCEGIASLMLGSDFFLPVGLLPIVSAITFIPWFVVPHARRSAQLSIRA